MGWSGNMCAPAPYVIDASAELIDRIAQDDMVPVSYTHLYYALLFKQSSQTKEVQIKEGGFGIGLWYENSIINNRCCYSLSGDTILSLIHI